MGYPETGFAVDLHDFVEDHATGQSGRYHDTGDIPTMLRVILQQSIDRIGVVILTASGWSGGSMKRSIAVAQASFSAFMTWRTFSRKVVTVGRLASTSEKGNRAFSDMACSKVTRGYVADLHMAGNSYRNAGITGITLKTLQG